MKLTHNKRHFYQKSLWSRSDEYKVSSLAVFVAPQISHNSKLNYCQRYFFGNIEA